MPVKNIIKPYLAEGIYHVYNRGVNKSNIFIDTRDYVVFLSCMKFYLSSIKTNDYQEKGNLQNVSIFNNFSDKVKLLCYVLMPNHFHLLLKQKEEKDVAYFMRSLMTKYIHYFNKKYHRVGPLFQSRYKGVLVDREEYFLHISRYIHRNPLDILPKGDKLTKYEWSSYPVYLNCFREEWLDTSLVVSYFKNTNGFGYSTYQGFVEGYQTINIDKTLLFDEF